MDDITYLSKAFYFTFNKKLNLNNPVTFNEKLQWLKINNHNPIYTIMADKHLVKEYVASKIGDEFIIPTICTWTDSNEIDFDSLPQKFVLKCNHNSGLGMVICKDKNNLTQKDKVLIRKGLSKGLNQDYYLTNREWPYKNIKRKIIAEQFLETSEESLNDYKLYCFNGNVKIILVCKDRFSLKGLTEDFYDTEWNHLDISRPNINHSSVEIIYPQRLNEMISIAEKLSNDIPFVRVDLYYVENRIYFGEMTFFPAAGLERYIPYKWDEIMGNWLTL